MQLKKGDIILVASVLAVAAIIFVVYLFVKPTEQGAFVKVNYAGKIIAEYPLDKDTIVPLSFDGHENVMQIQNGKAMMIQADCHDQICVRHLPIELSGEQIVCLPNKIVLEVFGTEKDKYDDLDVDM